MQKQTLGPVVERETDTLEIFQQLLLELEEQHPYLHRKFLRELGDHNEETIRTLESLQDAEELGKADTEDIRIVDDLIEEIIELLNDGLTDFVRFGRMPGTLGTYGYYVDMEDVQQANGEGQIFQIGHRSRWDYSLEQATGIVQYVNEFSNGSWDYILDVNDHGNATLYTTDGELIWSIV